MQGAFAIGSILFYLWVLQKNTPPAVHVPFLLLVCVGFPILCIALEQRQFPEFRLGWDRFIEGLRGIALFTLIATLALVSLAVWTDTVNYDRILPRRFAEYLLWAFLQQVGLQTFLTRRMQQVFRHPAGVAFASAVLFALIHFPNPVLMGFTLIGGMYWSLSFQKTPNLYALALSHAWLAVTALVCVPPDWMHQLRIGPDY